MKTHLINIFLFSFALAVSLFFIEIYIRFSYIEIQSPTDFTEDYGRCKRQNMDYVYFNEGFSMGRFNEGRYVNSFYPVEKPQGVIRIAALGDSYVEGFQVFERNHFLKLAENQLNGNLNDSIQILNFGRSGFDLGDMYAYYVRMVKQYNCDYVLFFISNNDLDIQQTDPLIPKIIIDKNKKIEVTNDLMPVDYKNKFIKQMLFSHFSTIYTMINNSRKLVKAGKFWPKLFDKFYSTNIPGPQGELVNKEEIIISETVYNILDNLKDEPSKIIFVNRDISKIDNKFINEVNFPLSYFDLTMETNFYNQKYDPHFWPITKKRGHWNNKANQDIGRILANKIKVDLALTN